MDIWLLKIKGVGKRWNELSKTRHVYYCPKKGRSLGGFFTTTPDAVEDADLEKVDPQKAALLVKCAIEYYRRRTEELERQGRYAAEMRRVAAKKLEELSKLVSELTQLP